jgi:hypothetical protein
VIWSSTASVWPTSSARTFQIVFPAAAGLFAAIDSTVSLAFLERFPHPTQAKADWLTTDRLTAWLAKVGNSGRVTPDVLHQRLVTAPRGTTGPEATTHAAGSPSPP